MKGPHRALIGNSMHSQLRKEAQMSLFKEGPADVSLPSQQSKCYYSVPDIVKCMRLRLSAKHCGAEMLYCHA